MRIIHCADIHFGSKMDSCLSREKADERKTELRSSFLKMIEYANEHDIGVILLVGDVFDSDRPFKKDKEMFYHCIKSNPQIDFLYLRGNHDIIASYTENDLPNLKMFTYEWSSYRYGNTVIPGIESNDENAKSMYATLKLDKDKKNIVLLHGQCADASGKFQIQLSKLRNKNIDYLALGHEHTFSDGKIDTRGKYAYAGCLEGRGFDEVGKKGFIVLEIENEVTYRFVENSCREIREVSVDISDTGSLFEAVEKVNREVQGASKDIVRINIDGETTFDLDGIEREVTKQAESRFYFVSVKNKATQRFDWNALTGDISLSGEFMRMVLSDSNYTDAEKQTIISYGLRALKGNEVDK